MKPSQVKSIRALARGLEVLQLLQASGALTLGQLHDLSKVPKASLLRILKTLMEQGVVWQRMADNAYVPSYSLSAMARRMDREDALVEAASAVLAQLSRDVKWPSVLAVPRGGHMEVIETSASRAMIDNVPLGPIGFQINMLRSASGRAYLAHCEDPLREATLERLRRSRRAGDRFARSDSYVAQIIDEGRAKGYSLRAPDFGGDYDQSRDAVDDERDSLAVAIRLGNHVPGAINITWARRIFTRDQAVKVFLAPITAAAEQIATALTEGADPAQDFTG